MNNTNKADVLLGLQWGDEGKGKIVDVFTPHYNIVARFQGGPNAGHTLVFENQKYVLHTIPSGIFHSGCVNVVGNGVVLDPFIISKELDQLCFPVSRIKESLVFCEKAHLILPSHRLLDAAYEMKKGDARIGSTLKGIGPAYTDKTARSGLRLCDAVSDGFSHLYKNLKEQHMQLISTLGVDVDDVMLDGLCFSDYEAHWFDALERLKELPRINSELFINEALNRGDRVLAEGAQGALLDINFGSYPFVTSSSTTVSGACAGLGIAPSRIGEVFGVFKSYCTRVGSGPFPTEIHDENATRLRDLGQEYGSTTGRPRRCGWLDLPALKYAVMINGVTRLLMTKADVLNTTGIIRVCVAYDTGDNQRHSLPNVCGTSEQKPVYRDMKGWQCSLEHIDRFEALPEELLRYVAMIEDFVDVPVDVISTGPDRKEILIRKGAQLPWSE